MSEHRDRALHATRARSKNIAASRAPILLGGGIAKIPLTRGLFALIDEADIALLDGLVWFAMRGGAAKRSNYAAHTFHGNGCPRPVFLHRWLLGAPDGVLVDHANGDTLDCRRANLRLATHSQNTSNQPNRKRGALGFRGVRVLARGVRKYYATISVDGVRHDVRRLKTAREAALAYDELARKHHGEFAVLNFPDLGGDA